MKTLINKQYFQIAGDMEVIYLSDTKCDITCDIYDEWGIVYQNNFIPLHTFEENGVIWYFTNDFQNLEISTFIAEIIPVKGLELSDVEWFKTSPLGNGYEHEYIVYFKIKGLESYHTTFGSFSSEAELIKNSANWL